MVHPLCLAGGFTKEEEGLYLFAVDQLLLAPGFSDDLPPVMLGRHRFDYHEQIDIPCALLRVVEEHGKVAAVSIKQELLEIVLQAREPFLACEVEVGATVGAGDVPGCGSADRSGLGGLRVGPSLRRRVAFASLPEAFHPQVRVSFVPRLGTLGCFHASLTLEFEGSPRVDAPSLDNSQRHHSQEEHDTRPLVHPPTVSAGLPGGRRKARQSEKI